jgi:hypothetical protein
MQTGGTELERLSKISRKPTEFLFVFYEEENNFKLRKTEGTQLSSLPREYKTIIELILDKFIKEVSNVVKSCSERYTGIETIICSNIVMLILILSILYFNQELLHNNVYILMIILTPILMGTIVTVFLCQVSKSTRNRRKSQISWKLENLTNELNTSFSAKTLQITLVPGYLEGRYFDFSLRVLLAPGATSLTESSHESLVAKRAPATTTSIELPISPEKPHTEEKIIRQPSIQLAVSVKPTRLKGKTATVGPSIMRRQPKMATILQTASTQNKSLTYFKAI